MQLFLVHCGYYDQGAFEGVFEAHADLFVVAEDFVAAKARAKEHPEFKRRKMHVDGMLRVEAVDGYRVRLEEDASLGGETRTERTPATWREMNAATATKT
jgi:hypothetical protein